jgi:hypothetical protein
MNEEMMEEFANMLRNHVEQTWTVTEEVSGNGNLFTRAVCKIAPVEVINCELGQFELPMN